MKKLLCIFLLTLLNLAVADLEVLKEGAAPGTWTMDMDAAVSLSQSMKKPILLFFTGSDWCGWCKKLESNVLTKESWKTFAKENLMLVYLDFPRNKALVPEKYQKRNALLQEKYTIQGFPTLIMIDETGTKLTELHYEESVELFIFMAKQPLRFRKPLFEKITKDMPEQDLKTLQKETQTIADNDLKIQELRKQIQVLAQEKEKLERKTDRDMDAWIIKSRLPEKYDTYKQTEERFLALEAECKAWLATNPAKTSQNMETFKNYKKTITELEQTCVKLLMEAWKTLE